LPLSSLRICTRRIAEVFSVIRRARRESCPRRRRLGESPLSPFLGDRVPPRGAAFAQPRTRRGNFDAINPSSHRQRAGPSIPLAIAHDASARRRLSCLAADAAAYRGRYCAQPGALTSTRRNHTGDPESRHLATTRSRETCFPRQRSGPPRRGSLALRAGGGCALSRERYDFRGCASSRQGYRIER